MFVFVYAGRRNVKSQTEIGSTDISQHNQEITTGNLVSNYNRELLYKLIIEERNTLLRAAAPVSIMWEFST